MTMESSVIRMGSEERPYFLIALGDGDSASKVVARCESEALAVKLASVLREYVPDTQLADLVERASWGVQISG